jgi:hypothetical protein
MSWAVSSSSWGYLLISFLLADINVPSLCERSANRRQVLRGKQIFFISVIRNESTILRCKNLFVLRSDSL